MISAFANSFKIPELRKRIIFTLMMLVVVFDLNRWITS